MRHSWTALLLVACSSSAPAPSPPPTVALLAGQETDTWGSATQVKLEAVASDGTRTLLATAPAPATKIPVPQGSIPTANFFRLEATATDASGTTVAWGSSVPYGPADVLAFGASVFIAHSGGWSRAPAGLAQAHVHANVAVAFAKFLLAVGGEPAGTTDLTVPDGYDAGYWLQFAGIPKLPRVPKSLVVGYTLDADGVDTDIEMLTIDDSSASWFNLTTGLVDTQPVTAPAGLTFAEIAGGEAIVMPDGSVFVIGATRQTGDPTDKVLHIDARGMLQALKLNTARVGAAAAIFGKTVVIAGGSASGAGIEALNAVGNAFTPLTFPADATQGSGLAALDTTKALWVGGKDPATGAAGTIRTFDPTCTDSCMATDVVALPMALVRAKVFVLQSTKALVIGEADDGVGHAFLLDTSAAMPALVEQPFREARKGATPVLLPNSQIGLIGGQAPDSGAPTLSIEAFFP